MPQHSNSKRSWRRLLLWPVVILGLIAFLSLSVSPSVPPAPPASAAQVRLARANFERLRDSGVVNRPVSFALGWRDAADIAQLGGHAVGLRRTRLDHGKDGLHLSASIPARFGLWWNIEAILPPNRPGLAGTWVWVGWLPVPPFLVGWAGEGARSLLAKKGTVLPPAETILHGLRFSKAGLTAKIHLPFLKPGRGLGGTPVEAKRVARLYCALIASHEKTPDPNLAPYVRTVFAESDGSVADNRAAFVALGMFAVSPRVADFSNGAAAKAGTCLRVGQDVRLLGRADLAKHWALSAAMAASLGEAVSGAMGVWKEVSDSGPKGSGFSFVDLAADRSGIHTARVAGREDSAKAQALRLSKISEEVLLPLKALALSEGLSEAAFRQKYVSTNSTAFDAAIARIDRVLKAGS